MPESVIGQVGIADWVLSESVNGCERNTHAYSARARADQIAHVPNDLDLNGE